METLNKNSSIEDGEKEVDKALLFINKLKEALLTAISSLVYDGSYATSKDNYKVFREINRLPLEEISKCVSDMCEALEYAKKDLNDRNRVLAGLAGIQFNTDSFYKYLMDFDDFMDKYSQSFLNDIDIDYSDDDWSEFQ